MGSILGLALGDAFGAPYEGGPVERLLWRMIGRTRGHRRWTDDTQMTIDVIESLMHCGKLDQDDLARRFARSYRWSRGYGPGAARVLKRIRRGEPWNAASRAFYKDGSYGNGGAMRAAPIGLFFAAGGEDAVAEAAEAAAMITHAHPLGREGAVLVALAVGSASCGSPAHDILPHLCKAAQSPKFAGKLTLARDWLAADHQPTAEEVAKQLGNGVAATESCVTAIYLSLRFTERPFDAVLDVASDIGGDVDTIAAMAGGIWGALRGEEALPEQMLQQVEAHYKLKRLAEGFAAAVRAAINGEPS